MRRRFYIIVASALLWAIFCVLVFFRYSSQIAARLGEHPIIHGGILLFSLVPTGVLWHKLRHRPEVGSWLSLKIAANLVLFIAVACAWLFNLPVEVMFLGVWLAIILGAVSLARTWESRKGSRTQVEPDQK
jgi:hypothetical protein